MSHKDVNETRPTWEDYAVLEREVGRLKAKCNVLKRDNEGADAALDDLSGTIEGLRARLAARRRKVLELNADLAEKHQTIGGWVVRAQALADRVHKLEMENGVLEAELARAKGRVVVVARGDKVAAMAKAIFLAKGLLDRALPSLPNSDILGSGGSTGTMDQAKMRQVQGLLARTMTELVILERDIEQLPWRCTGCKAEAPPGYQDVPGVVVREGDPHRICTNGGNSGVGIWTRTSAA